MYELTYVQEMSPEHLPGDEAKVKAVGVVVVVKRVVAAAEASRSWRKDCRSRWQQPFWLKLGDR